MWILAAIWTLIAAASLLWNINSAQNHAFSEMRTHAKSIYKQDFIYRVWNAQHGGVYVPVTQGTPPNPYLSHIPDRDVTTTDGKKLTLINPAYMTRQVHELLELRKHGNRGHITSLNPIRPQNKADAWESKALRRFDKGESEVFSVETMENGKEYFRYMHVMKVEKACLKCHAAQGYKIGDIRGGISVSIPSHDYMHAQRAEVEAIILGHGVLWVLGMGVLFFGGRRQVKATAELLRSEEDFRNIFEYATDAIYLIDPDTARIIDCNKKASELDGYSIEELGTMTVLEIHPEEELAKLSDIFKTVNTAGTLTGISGFNHLRKDGRLVPVEVNAALVNINDRQINLSFVRDVSERAKVEQEMSQRLEELERFQAATVAREFRIKELLDEVEALKKMRNSEAPDDKTR